MCLKQSTITKTTDVWLKTAIIYILHVASKNGFLIGPIDLSIFSLAEMPSRAFTENTDRCRACHQSKLAGVSGLFLPFNICA
jgi:hypothetical protein